MGGIFVKWAHIAGYNYAIGILHEENVFADRKPHHPIYFPPQGVINGHLELRWESQSGYRSQQASPNPTPCTASPWMIQAPMWCAGLGPAPPLLGPK